MKNILVITGGETPQIVTETLWALARQPEPFWPDELYLVTTTLGWSRCQEKLLQDDGPLAQLCKALKQKQVRVQKVIPVLGDGSEIPDVRNNDQVIAFGDRIASLIADLAADGDNRIHLSLAGGRKTMSYYAGAAISLFGRAQDELSHVLVHPQEMEFAADFWWPYDPPRDVSLRDGKVKSTAGSTVDMAKVPFVRQGLTLANMPSPGEVSFYKQIVIAAQRSINARRVILNCEFKTLTIADVEIQLPNRQFALYRLFAVAVHDRWKIENNPPGWLSLKDIRENKINNKPIRDIYLEFYADTFKGLTNEEEKGEVADFRDNLNLKSEIFQKSFQKSTTETKTNLHKQIRKTLNDSTLARRFEITGRKLYIRRTGEETTTAASIFGLSLLPDEIEIIE